MDVDALCQIFRSPGSLTQFFKKTEFAARDEGLRVDISTDNIEESVQCLHGPKLPLSLLRLG